MNSYPTISKSEWLIMKCLWRTSHALTIKEIHICLASETKWTDNMVRALVSRMAEKRSVGVDRTKRPYAYYPLVDEKNSDLWETLRFLNRVFDGSAPKCIEHLISAGYISKKDRNELQNLISN